MRDAPSLSTISETMILTRVVNSPIPLFLLLAMLLSACDGSAAGYSISGTVSVASFSVADSDTNDVNSQAVANDSIATAQVVPNPATIGGYVNEAGTGPEGRSQQTGDREDYFLADLKQGQEIQLTISAFENNDVDLNLYLYDAQGQLVDASLGRSKFESLVVPVDGIYYINPYALRGASTYRVSLGLANTSSTSSANRFRLSADFVPGQIVAKASSTFKQTRSLSVAGSSLKPVLHQGAQVGLYELDGVGVTSSSTRSLGSQLDKIYQGTTPEQQAKLETLMAAKALSRQSGMVYAEPNYRKQALLTPNDEFYPLQWHYPLINLPAAWDITTGGREVIVAIIDSGVALSHVDLQGQLLGGYDFISDPRAARDGDGIDSNPNDEGDLGGGSGSSSFHGTHVAGTVAAASNNELGVAGVSWDTSLMPIRVIGVGGGSDFDIAQGVLYAASLPNASGTVPPKRADIINLSLGGPDQSQVLTDALSAARAAGVIIIAAAGNDGTAEPMYPASSPGVVSVSAVDANRQLAPYSSFGSTVDIAAPGGDLNQDVGGDGQPDGVLSTLVDDQGSSLIGYYNGTSMAAPHIAGVAALMKSVYSGLGPAEFDSMLVAGQLTTDIGDAGKDTRFGYGLVDARKAVVAAQSLGGGSGSLPPPLLSVIPQSVNFGQDNTQTTLYVENAGSEDLTVTGVSESEDWLSVSSLNTNGAGLGSYTVLVDRSNLEPGVYQTNIVFSSSANTVSIPVIMEVSEQNGSGDLGLVYFLLYDESTQEAVKQTSATATNGQYNFSMSGIPAGQYTLVMGSDMNNDDFICDEGEACGIYPTLSRPETIELTENVSDLRF
ncbi:MAG: S8 family serine peptidase, partial [bacterium]